MKSLLKLILSIVFLFFSLTFAMSLGTVIGQVNAINQNEIAFCVAAIMGIIVFRKKFPVFNTWLHEHNHLLVSLLFGKSIRDIRVTKNSGGYIEHLGSSNFIISLSPYAIPLFAIIILITKYLISDSFIMIPFIISGIFYGQHIIAALRDTRIAQTDISGQGFLFSCSFILFSNILFFGIILIVVTNDFPLKPLYHFMINGLIRVFDIPTMIEGIKRFLG